MRKSRITYEDVENKIKELELNNWEIKYLEDKYQSIFDDAPLGIFRCTPEGEFLEVNDAFAGMLGFAGSDYFFKTDCGDLQTIFLNKEEKSRVLGNVFTADQAVRTEVALLCKDAQPKTVNLCLKVVRNKDAGRYTSKVP